MSIKIYNGIRFPAARLNDFLEHVYRCEHESMFAHVCELLLLRDGIASIPPQTDAERLAVLEDWDRLSRKLTEGSTKLSSIWNWESGWNIWIDSEMVYTWGWGSHNGTKFDARVGELDFVEDYRYFDNAYRPSGITEREWHKRRDTWERIALADFPLQRLVYLTISFIPGAGHSEGFIWDQLGL